MPLKVDHALTHDYGNDQRLMSPLQMRADFFRESVLITLLGKDGVATANIAVEVQDGVPLLRVWDGEKGVDNDPIIRRELNLAEDEV